MTLVKINKNFAVDPSVVIGIQLNEKDLTTSIIISGIPIPIKSDYTFDETIRLILGELVSTKKPH